MTCPLCTDRAKSEIWRNGNFYLIDAEDPAFPCFLRVVSCRHVPEMSSLTSEERTELWGILNVVEEEIIKALRPHKVNLAQFGNMVPHLHWHVIARSSPCCAKRSKSASAADHNPFGQTLRPIPSAFERLSSALTCWSAIPLKTSTTRLPATWL